MMKWVRRRRREKTYGRNEEPKMMSYPRDRGGGGQGTEGVITRWRRIGMEIEGKRATRGLGRGSRGEIEKTRENR